MGKLPFFYFFFLDNIQAQENFLLQLIQIKNLLFLEVKNS